jgi:SMODS and SLOG-associating 2TM effector domain
MERLYRYLHRDHPAQHERHGSDDVERKGSSPEREADATQDDRLPPSPTIDRAAAQSAAEKLRTFRLVVGISNDPQLTPYRRVWSGFSREQRVAPNLGIYARVVHNEKVAKDGYKRYSVLINSCLGAQLIVAAALTAMGAANSGHATITAFGAINTVIAGFLTYLKGSGLPARLKYYQNEWKRLREYIEQRERELSRAATGGWRLPPGHDLDNIVNTIEHMYNETKSDIEVNTPDGYTSISRNQRLAGGPPLAQTHRGPGGVQQSQYPQSFHPTHPSVPVSAHLPTTDRLHRSSTLDGIGSMLQGALDDVEKRGRDVSADGNEPGTLETNSLTQNLEQILPANLTSRLHRLSARLEGDTHDASDAATHVTTDAGVATASVAASGVETADRAVGSAASGAGRTADGVLQMGKRALEGLEGQARSTGGIADHAAEDVARQTLEVARDLELHGQAVQEARRRVERLVGHLGKNIREEGKKEKDSEIG